MTVVDWLDLPISPRSPGQHVPLTIGQSAAWAEMAKRGASLSDLRMCAASVRVTGPLDLGVLRSAIEAVVQRHESLRTRIVATNGTPAQHVDPPGPLPLPVIDIARSAATGGDCEARRIASEFLSETIDLSVGPLFAARVLRVSDHEHLLILALDHMVSDAASFVILRRDLWSLYGQLAKRSSAGLPALEIQFPDFAVWQRRAHPIWQSIHGMQRRAQIASAPRLQLPLNAEIEGSSPTQSSFLHIPFGRKLTSDLRVLCHRESAPLPLIVLTLYAAALSRWCKQRDFVLAFFSHGRFHRSELANMIGALALILPLRIEISMSDSFIDLLGRVSLELRTAQAQHGFGTLSDIAPEHSINAAFHWSPGGRDAENEVTSCEGTLVLGRFPISPLRIPSFRSNETSLMFSPWFTDTKGGIIATIRYRPHALERRSIEEFGDDMRSLAKALVDNPLASFAQ